MIAVWSFLLRYRFLLAGLVIALVIIGGYFYIRNDAYNDGQEACKAAYEKQIAQNLKKAQDNIQKEKASYEKRIRELQAKGDSGDGNGRITRATLDFLRNR